MQSFLFPPERVWIPEPGLATLLHIAAAVLLLLGIVLLKVRRTKPVTWRELSIGVVLTVSVFVLLMLAHRGGVSNQPLFVSFLVVTVPIAVLAAITMVVVELAPGEPLTKAGRTELDSLDDEPASDGQSLQTAGVPFARMILVSSILTGCVFVWLVPAFKQAREAARLSSEASKLPAVMVTVPSSAASSASFMLSAGSLVPSTSVMVCCQGL